MSSTSSTQPRRRRRSRGRLGSAVVVFPVSVFPAVVMGALVLGALALSALLAGCASAATVHPDFARLQPRTIHVAPVANETTYHLDTVSFGGLLQRAVIGGETFDVPRILGAALEEALVAKGYHLDSGVGAGGAAGTPEDRGAAGTVDPTKPQPEAPPPFDASCIATIEEWRSDKLSTNLFYLRYRLEIRRVPTGEILYCGRFFAEHREDARDPGGPSDLESSIRRSVRGALSALPKAAAEHDVGASQGAAAPRERGAQGAPGT